MDIKGQGFEATVVAADQTDQWLLDAANEIREAAEARGLEVPAFAGATATDATTDVELVAVVEVVPETKESIFGQLDSAVTGYNAVMNSLNAGKRRNNKVETQEPATIEAALGEWLTDERLEIVNDMKEKQPGVEFTLIATPNVLTTAKDIIRIAEKFGADQPYSTYVWEELYKQYNVEQLSGTSESSEAVVNFALIPSQFTPWLEGTVTEQRAALANVQAIHPELKVPSVLDAVTYWATLRAQGESLTGEGTFDRTYIRHFDLPERRFDDWSYVPKSFVFVNGEPYLYRSSAGSSYDGRVAVG